MKASKAFGDFASVLIGAIITLVLLAVILGLLWIVFTLWGLVFGA